MKSAHESLLIKVDVVYGKLHLDGACFLCFVVRPIFVGCFSCMKYPSYNPSIKKQGCAGGVGEGGCVWTFICVDNTIWRPPFPRNVIPYTSKKSLY